MSRDIREIVTQSLGKSGFNTNDLAEILDYYGVKLEDESMRSEFMGAIGMAWRNSYSEGYEKGWVEGNLRQTVQMRDKLAEITKGLYDTERELTVHGREGRER